MIRTSSIWAPTQRRDLNNSRAKYFKALASEEEEEARLESLRTPRVNVTCTTHGDRSVWVWRVLAGHVPGCCHVR